ncbi:MAG: hypothetical protein V5A72_02840 [Candidatus Nanohaloarchaea archaeon]
MEGKIVAATFTTLALVFAGMSGTSVNTDVDEVLPSESSPLNDFTSSFDILDSLMENPEAENPVTMEIKLSENPNINIDSETLQVQGLKNIEGTIAIDSDEDLLFSGFSGNIKMDNTTEIIGSAEGFRNSKINVTSRVGLDENVETDLILAEGLERHKFKFEADDISLESKTNESSISQSNTDVKISSFTGDLELNPPNTLIFDGEIATVTAGKTSFGN